MIERFRFENRLINIMGSSDSKIQTINSDNNSLQDNPPQSSTYLPTQRTYSQLAKQDTKLPSVAYKLQVESPFQAPLTLKAKKYTQQ